MKKAYKVLSVLMVVLMLVCISTNVFAAFDVNQISASADTNADTAITNIGSTILTIVTNVGMILAIIIVAILGVKYMMGSTEEKAEYKKTLMPYLIGAVLVFGASAIGKAVINLGTSLIQ